MKEIDFKDLIQSRQIQAEPAIGRDQVQRLMKRADKDLASAEAVKAFDEAAAMDLVYKAMFHASNALLGQHKLRPGPFRQHQGVIEAVGRILGPEARSLMLKFDRLRKRRNQFEYEGLFEMGSQELKDALIQASELVDVIRRRVAR
jgi:uncharacterized protein (UPF0332 family)